MCLRLAQLPDSPAMNSTLSPTSRFGLWFLTGTGVFLAVTAVLKLYSGLLETKVLGAADPLLPLFTVRQLMFLAALLELAVAFVLFRPKHAETAPWLVLWLVGVFTAYRVGLWAVGFQGHCSCLGHVLDFLPVVWLDRLMVASLGVMGLGSVGCIAARRHRAFFGHIRAGVGTTTVVLLLPAGSGTLEARAGDVPPLAITAQYRSELFRPGSTEPIRSIELRISIYSSNRWWRIRTDPLDTGLLPIDGMRIPDGVRHHLAIAHDSSITNWFPSADTLPTTHPNPANTGMLLAWLAYVPQAELPVLDNHRIRRFSTFISADAPPQIGTYGAEWLLPQSQFLSRLTITNNGIHMLADGTTTRQTGVLAKGWLELAYEVSLTTNVTGVTLPAFATLRHFWLPLDAGSTNDLKVTCLESIRMLAVGPLTAETWPEPYYPVMLALDRRLPWLAKGRSVNYFVTNDVWKPLNDPELRSLAAIEHNSAIRPTSSRRMLLGALLVLIVVCPILVFLVRLVRSHKS